MHIMIALIISDLFGLWTPAASKVQIFAKKVTYCIHNVGYCCHFCFGRSEANCKNAKAAETMAKPNHLQKINITIDLKPLNRCFSVHLWALWKIGGFV